MTTNALVTPWPSSITSITTLTRVNNGAMEMSMPPPRIAGVEAMASSAGVASSAKVTGHADQDSSECCAMKFAMSSATASRAGSSQARSRRAPRPAGTSALPAGTALAGTALAGTALAGTALAGTPPGATAPGVTDGTAPAAPDGTAPAAPDGTASADPVPK